jgi:hypothetical protein
LYKGISEKETAPGNGGGFFWQVIPGGFLCVKSPDSEDPEYEIFDGFHAKTQRR